MSRLALVLALAGCSVSEPDAGRVVALPLVVSDEFSPSGFMGDGAVRGALQLSDGQRCAPRPAGAAGSCYRFEYTPPERSVGWAGIYWQTPANNWGQYPGKRIAPGLARVRLRAAGAVGGELVTFRVGGLTAPGPNGEPLPYQDTFQAELSTSLGTALAEYEVPVAGAEYDAVLGGFALSALAPADGATVVVYLDDVRWE